MSIGRSPFNHTFLAAAGGDRIYAAPTDSAVIYVWNGAGTPVDTLRWEEPLRPIDAALVAAVAEQETKNLDASEAAQRRRSREEDPHPTTAPVFDRLLLGPDGEVWVRRFDDPRADASEGLIFGEAGAGTRGSGHTASGRLRPGAESEGARLLAHVRIPHQREIRAVGRARVYTLERDEYDVEHVRAYVLHRSGG